MVSKLHYFRSFNDFLRWVRSMGYTKREAEKYWRGTGYYYHRGKGYFCKYDPMRGSRGEHYDKIRFRASLSYVSDTSITIAPRDTQVLKQLKPYKHRAVDVILIIKTPKVHKHIDHTHNILILYKKGYSIKQIARELGLSYHTVYYRLRKLLGKNKK